MCKLAHTLTTLVCLSVFQAQLIVKLFSVHTCCVVYSAAALKPHTHTHTMFLCVCVCLGAASSYRANVRAVHPAAPLLPPLTHHAWGGGDITISCHQHPTARHAPALVFVCVCLFSSREVDVVRIHWSLNENVDLFQ